MFFSQGKVAINIISTNLRIFQAYDWGGGGVGSYISVEFPEYEAQ